MTPPLASEEAKPVIPFRSVPTRILIVFLTLSAAALSAQERTFVRDYPVAPGARLSLESYKGLIRIRTDAVPSIRVAARIYPDGGADPELVDLVEIRERSGPDFVSLAVEYGDTDRAWQGLLGSSRTLPLVDWEITVPDDASLELESHKAEFDVDAPAGRLEVETHKGHGNLRQVRGDLRLDTHKGTFDVEVTQLDGMRIDTHKGDISITVRGATDFSLRADSYKGRLDFSGRDVPIEIEDGESLVDYREGSGRHRIDLSTHKGTIRVAFEG